MSPGYPVCTAKRRPLEICGGRWRHPELNVVDVGARVSTDERHFTSWPSIRLVDGILLRRAKARGRASAAVLGESYAPAKRGRIEAAEGVQGRLRSHREQSLLANPPPPELSVHSKADRKEQ